MKESETAKAATAAETEEKKIDDEEEHAAEDEEENVQLAEEEEFIDQDKETEQLYEKSPLLDFSESFRPFARGILKKLTSAVDEQKYEGILEEVVKEIEKFPQNAELYYLKAGIQMEWMHLKDDALVSLNKAIEIDPKYYRAHLLKGYLQFRNEKMDDAITTFSDALAVSTQKLDTAYVLKLDALMRKKSPEACQEGIRTASQAIGKAEEYYEEENKKGSLRNTPTHHETDKHDTKGDKEAGIQEAFSVPDMYHFALELIYQYKAAFQAQLGDYVGALVTLQEGVNASNPSGDDNRKRKLRDLVGNAFYMQGVPEEAESRWQEVYERDPWNTNARLLSLLVAYETKNGPVPLIKELIRFDLEQGLNVTLQKAEVTKKLLDYFLTETKPSQLATEITALLHGVRLERDLALQKFDELLKENPDHHFAYVGKGSYLQFQGKYNEAIEQYQKALNKVAEKHGEESDWRTTLTTALTDSLLTCYSDAGRWKDLLKFGMAQWELQDQADLHYIMHVALHKLNLNHKCNAEEITEEDLASFPDAKPEDLVDDPEFLKLFPKTKKGKKAREQDEEEEEDLEDIEETEEGAEGAQKVKKSKAEGEEGAAEAETKKKPKKAKKSEDETAEGEDKKKKKGGRRKKTEESDLLADEATPQQVASPEESGVKQA